MSEGLGIGLATRAGVAYLSDKASLVVHARLVPEDVRLDQ